VLDNGLPPVVAPGPGVVPRIVDATPASTIRLSVLSAGASNGCASGTPGCNGAPTPATGGQARTGLALGVLLAALLVGRTARRPAPVASN